jgi:hypothetical protein
VPLAEDSDYGHTSMVKIHPTLSVPMVAIDPNGVKDQWVHDDLGRVRHALPQAGNVRTTDYERWMGHTAACRG